MDPARAEDAKHDSSREKGMPTSLSLVFPLWDKVAQARGTTAEVFDLVSRNPDTYLLRAHVRRRTAESVNT